MAGPVPTLLLRPEGSRDRNGVVSPTLSGGVLTVPGKYGQAWQVAEATTNYVFNPRIEDIYATSYAWDQTLNGSPRESRSWSTYNGGVPSPGVGYHAHAIAGGGPDGESCIALINRNAQFGQAGRYLAGSIGLNELIGPVIAVGSVVTVSFDMKSSDTACYITAGIYHRNTSGAMTFTGATGNVYNTKPGAWERRSISYTVESAWDLAYAPRLYMYGQNGPEGDKWFANVQVEVKGYATPCAAGSDGPGHAWTGTAYASSSTRTGGFLYLSGMAARMSPVAGEVMIRYRRHREAGGLLFASSGNSGAANQYYKALSTVGNGRVQSGSRQPPAAADPAAITTSAVTAGTHAAASLWWIETQLGVTAPTGEVSTVTRQAPLYPFNDVWTFGAYNATISTLNGDIEAIVMFDRPLTPNERAQLLTMPRAWEWDALFPPDDPDLPAYRSRVFLLAPRIYTADRDNRLGSEITRAVTHAAVDADIDRAGPKGQLQIAATDPAVLPANGWIAPFLDVTHEDGTLDSAQMGLYQLDQPEIAYDMTGQATASATGVDIVGQLEAWPLGTAQTTAVGEAIMQDVKDGLTALGFRHSLPDDPRTATTAISHSANVSWLARFNDLLAAIGYHALYATADGRLTSRPLRDARQDTPARTYATGRDSAIVDPVTIRRAAGNLFNVVVAVKEDFQAGTALVAEARNDDPEHPWSTVALGREIAPAQPITVMEAVDQDALQAIADDRLARVSMQEELMLELLPDPTLAVHDVIEITGTDGPEGGRWSVESLAWGLTADSPLVRVGARRTYTTTAPGGD